MAFCGNCGGGNPDSAAFCMHCDATTARGPDSEQDLATESGESSTQIGPVNRGVGNSHHVLQKPWYRKAVIAVPAIVASMSIATLLTSPEVVAFGGSAK